MISALAYESSGLGSSGRGHCVVLDTLLSVPLSTQVRRTSCLGGVGGGKTCEGVEILLVASCYEKREGGGGDR